MEKLYGFSFPSMDNTELNMVLTILLCGISGIPSALPIGKHISKMGPVSQISIELYLCMYSHCKIKNFFCSKYMFQIPLTLSFLPTKDEGQSCLRKQLAITLCPFFYPFIFALVRLHGTTIFDSCLAAGAFAYLRL